MAVGVLENGGTVKQLITNTPECMGRKQIIELEISYLLLIYLSIYS